MLTRMKFCNQQQERDSVINNMLELHKTITQRRKAKHTVMKSEKRRRSEFKWIRKRWKSSISVPQKKCLTIGKFQNLFKQQLHGHKPGTIKVFDGETSYSEIFTPLTTDINGTRVSSVQTNTEFDNNVSSVQPNTVVGNRASLMPPNTEVNASRTQQVSQNSEVESTDGNYHGEDEAGEAPISYYYTINNNNRLSNQVSSGFISYGNLMSQSNDIPDGAASLHPMISTDDSFNAITNDQESTLQQDLQDNQTVFNVDQLSIFQQRAIREIEAEIAIVHQCLLSVQMRLQDIFNNAYNSRLVRQLTTASEIFLQESMSLNNLLRNFSQVAEGETDFLGAAANDSAHENSGSISCDNQRPVAYPRPVVKDRDLPTTKSQFYSVPAHTTNVLSNIENINCSNLTENLCVEMFSQSHMVSVEPCGTDIENRGVDHAAYVSELEQVQTLVNTVPTLELAVQQNRSSLTIPLLDSPPMFSNNNEVKNFSNIIIQQSFGVESQFNSFTNGIPSLCSSFLLEDCHNESTQQKESYQPVALVAVTSSKHDNNESSEQEDSDEAEEILDQGSLLHSFSSITSSEHCLIAERENSSKSRYEAISHVPERGSSAINGTESVISEQDGQTKGAHSELTTNDFTDAPNIWSHTGRVKCSDNAISQNWVKHCIESAMTNIQETSQSSILENVQNMSHENAEDDKENLSNNQELNGELLISNPSMCSSSSSSLATGGLENGIDNMENIRTGKELLHEEQQVIDNRSGHIHSHHRENNLSHTGEHGIKIKIGYARSPAQATNNSLQFAQNNTSSEISSTSEVTSGSDLETELKGFYSSIESSVEYPSASNISDASADSHVFAPEDAVQQNRTTSPAHLATRQDYPSQNPEIQQEMSRVSIMQMEEGDRYSDIDLSNPPHQIPTDIAIHDDITIVLHMPR